MVVACFILPKALVKRNRAMSSVVNLFGVELKLKNECIQRPNQPDG